MAIDVEKYRKRLTEERDKLNQELGVVGETPEPATDDPLFTPSDAPLIDEAMDIQSAVLDMKSQRFDQVRAALQSIDDGTYGKCITCGKEIDPRRLDADPAAMTCIEDANKEPSIETPSL